MSAVSWAIINFPTNTAVLISPYPVQERNKLGSMSGTRAISTTSSCELSSGFFFLQDKAPKEIHAILTETLACFLPGQAKDLSAPLYSVLFIYLFIYLLTCTDIKVIV